MVEFHRNTLQQNGLSLVQIEGPSVKATRCCETWIFLLNNYQSNASDEETAKGNETLYNYSFKAPGDSLIKKLNEKM